MKKSTIQEIAILSIDELKKRLKELRLDVAKLNVEMQAKRLKDVSILGKKRKNIAQILTFIHQKKESN